MTVTFVILAAATIAGALAAMTMRNLVHCALALTVAFGGLALFYLQLSAQFVGLAQILVYVGAVAILIVFAILLTKGTEPASEPIFSPSWLAGVAIALIVFGVLAGIIASSKALSTAQRPAPETSVREIGTELMTKYVVPLEVIGLLLTAALIGAVIIARHESESK
jgi:NADH-quinone oxidoreductase subunit J